ncbi:hypothetical protein HGRIS_006918 [Hohenbuehelia grisea]|uniref:Uncharacterized protein n=1 Tax=Hohenbuehelia grisea TaxID=104357 RepID=A0ABR3JAK6_9AGAR
MGVGVKAIAAAAPYAWKKWNNFRRNQTADSDDEEHGAPARTSTMASYDPEYSHPVSPARPLPMSPSYSAGSFASPTGSGSTMRPGMLSYGSVEGSPEGMRRDSMTLSMLGRVPEEDGSESESESEWEAEMELELEDQGLYSGSYTRTVALYTLVPLTTIAIFTVFAALPRFAYPLSQHPSTPPHAQYPYLPYLPYPLPEILTAISLWSLTYLLRQPLHALVAVLFTPLTLGADHWLASALAAILTSTTAVLAHLAALGLLLVPRYVAHDADEGLRAQVQAHYLSPYDLAFRRVWALALGWAAAEAVVATKLGYERIALYRSVMVGVPKHGAQTSFSWSHSRPASAGVAEVSDSKSKSKSPEFSSRQAGGGVHVDFDVPPQNGVQSQSQSQNSNGSRSRPAPIRVSSETAAPHHQNNGGMFSSGIVESPVDYLRRDHRAQRNDNSHQDASGTGDDERAPLLGRSSRERDVEREAEREEVRRRAAIDEEIRALLDEDFDELMALKTREEVEEMYGMPFIKIPVFISCMQRLSAVLLSLGFFLLLSSAYILANPPSATPPTPTAPPSLIPWRTAAYFNRHSQLPNPPPPPHILHASSSLTPSLHSNHDHDHDHTPTRAPLLATVAALVLIQLVLTVLHMPSVLPRIGVHTAVYVGLLVALGGFFAGLGTWGALS